MTEPKDQSDWQKGFTAGWKEGVAQCEALRSPAPADGRGDQMAEKLLRTLSGESDGLGAVKQICEALGFDPTNHHNALKCPYCNPDRLSFAPPVADATPIEPPTEVRADGVKVKALKPFADLCVALDKNYADYKDHIAVFGCDGWAITHGDFRRALSAYRSVLTLSPSIAQTGGQDDV